jgi:autotransporter-associated beta strand protein
VLGGVADGASVITGTGSVIKSGAGALTLYGTSTYTGTTTVSGGALTVNGSIATSNTTVTANGTLNGTGTVGNTTIAGGVFAPGSGVASSSQIVTGTLGFTSGTYRTYLDPTTASQATVSGTATLGGATVNAQFAPGAYVAKQYTVLTAGSVSGTFNPAVQNTNLPANTTDTLSYDGTHAYLNLGLAFSGGLNQNQQNVANALTG